MRLVFSDRRHAGNRLRRPVVDPVNTPVSPIRRTASDCPGVRCLPHTSQQHCWTEHYTRGPKDRKGHQWSFQRAYNKLRIIPRMVTHHQHQVPGSRQGDIDLNDGTLADNYRACKRNMPDNRPDPVVTVAFMQSRVSLRCLVASGCSERSDPGWASPIFLDVSPTLCITGHRSQKKPLSNKVLLYGWPLLGLTLLESANLDDTVCLRGPGHWPSCSLAKLIRSLLALWGHCKVMIGVEKECLSHLRTYDGGGVARAWQNGSQLLPPNPRQAERHHRRAGVSDKFSIRWCDTNALCLFQGVQTSNERK